MSGLADLAWPDLTASAVLAVPVGATEQHGPHLPFTVDTEIAVALCERLAEDRADVVVAPAFAYGSSGEHAAFPGTLSLGRPATELALLELIRSADAFAAVLLVSAHGGNAEPVHRALIRSRAEGRRADVWSPTGPAGDSHAGHTETSVMLALRPAAVRLDRLAVGVTTPLPELIEDLRAGGVRPVSPDGVLGDPTTATAEAGHTILDRWTRALHLVADQLLPR